MAHTHLCLLYHMIWGTKHHHAFLNAGARDNVHASIAGIIKNMDGKALIIGGQAEHIHILCYLRAKPSIADVIGTIKTNSSSQVKEILRNRKFAWQDGYGAFTVSESNRQTVYRYIQNQDKHHKKMTFCEEYLGFLQKHGIEYDERYVFD